MAAPLSRDVQVRRYPPIELAVGGKSRPASCAVVLGLSGTADFRYGVSDGDLGADGIGINANSIGLNYGEISDSAESAAGLSHQAVAANDRQRVSVTTQDLEVRNLRPHGASRRAARRRGAPTCRNEDSDVSKATTATVGRQPRWIPSND